MYALYDIVCYFKNLYQNVNSSSHDHPYYENKWQASNEVLKNVFPLGHVDPDKYLRGYGKVTKVLVNGGMIDNRIYYNSTISHPSTVKENDIVEYLYEQGTHNYIDIVKILSIVESMDDGLTFANTESSKTTKRVVITKVTERRGRDVLGSESGVQFNLDNVKIDFLPVVGDWLELICVTKVTKGDSTNNTESEILEVRALRSLEVKTSSITHWDASAHIGTIGNIIFFTSEACSSFTPCIGDKVVVDAIESDQGNLTWRAVTVVFLSKPNNSARQKGDMKMIDNNNESNNIVTVKGELNFGKMMVGNIATMDLEVTNATNHPQVLAKVVFCSPLKDSQLKMIKGPKAAFEIGPKQSITCTFECKPSFLGFSEEMIKFCFKNFSVKRTFKVFVVNEFSEQFQDKQKSIPKTDMFRVNARRYMETHERNVIKGVKIARAPAFIKVRVPTFSIPTTLWSILLKYHETKLLHSNIVEESIPILADDLNFTNYREKFHTLLYLEEIAHTVALRAFDMPQAYLLPEGEYLTLEIKGLAEGRPSLVVGDCVKVRNPYEDNAPVYEGFIHETSNDKVYVKFAPKFHNSYQGEDVAVFFTTSRTNMVLAHYAVDLSTKHLGREILFPDKFYAKEPTIQISNSSDVAKNNGSNSRTRIVEWYNDKLNEFQKAAIINAVKNVCRPLPYIIFGPPGTGKTVTLVEAILQIWKLLPESRMLVVTPSNSSADLITERLIDSSNITPGSLVRIIAFHVLRTNSISEKLKPYCATIDISEQNLSHQVQIDDEDRKIFLKPNIGRHRITITTCVAAGKLIHLGFPKGHFSHILIDEAGQASEPESVIPLSFLDKSSGQVILAGDPQQLGPVVISNHGIQYGLEESYLGRLIKTLPYKRDIDSYKGKCDGYNPKLITKLLYNYRAIPKLLSLPSELYYNASLISKVSVDTEWVDNIITKVSPEVKLSDDNQHPGIVFYGIRGINMKEEDSPSWYNPYEASMLALFVSKLYANGISVNDIGIISPYIQQNKFIRSTLADLELDIPKVGTVEEFQGQERMIILASTVRSCQENEQHPKFTKNLSDRQIMGFLRNPKRLNVLLTRAQVLLVIFGNPHTLAMHEDWRHVIEYSIKFGSYVGCDVPNIVDVRRF